MPRSLVPAIGRSAVTVLLLLASSLAAPGPVRAQEPVLPQLTGRELAEQRTELRKLQRFMLMQKARAKLQGARQHEALLKRAARGDKKAQRELAARGTVRARRPVEDTSVLNAPESQVTRPAAPASAGATASIPANVRANNPAGDNASAGQCEEAIAVLGDNILVAWNDGQGFVTGGDTQGFGWSSDGGLTFTDGGDILHPPGFPLWEWTSDPVVAVNEKTGEFWYCGLANPNATNNAIGVARGRFTAGVFAFDSAFVVRSASNASFFLDKQWIAVDSLTGNLYVSNTTFTVTGDQIDFYRSTTGGRTWSAAQTLSSPGDEGLVQGSRPAVGPDGEVHVVWSAIGQVNDFDYMRFRTSVNGGVSFLAETNASQFISNFGSGAPGFNRERGLAFPSISVDRTTGTNRGRVYVSWNESWDYWDDGFPTITAAIARSESDVSGNNTTNNTTGTANPFSVGHVLRGTLQKTSNVQDVDLFAVTLAAGQRFFFWADSFTTGRAFRMRLYAPTPDANQRLCYTAKLDSTSTQNYAIFIFQAPTAGTYYLRLDPISHRTMGYRIVTTAGVKGGENARDQRDAMVAWSDDGAAWSTPVIMNDDIVGLDNWLPEVGVGADGLPYGLWFDHRDDTYGSRAHVYMTRSTDGGTAWAANQRITSAQTNFTTAPVNIAPNQGDYSHIAASTTRLHPTWSDGRAANPSVDVFTSAVPTTSAITVCPNDTTVNLGDVGAFFYELANQNPLFGGTYGVTLSSERSWDVSGAGSVAIPAESSAGYTLNVTVPDTAAAGVNTICLTLTTPGGVIAGQCCFDVTVPAGDLGVGDHLSGFALAPSWPNPARGSARIAFSLPNPGRVKLSVYDLAGARVRTLVDGERTAGAQSVLWDGRDSQGSPVRAGAYFIRLEHAGRALNQRLVMTK